MRLEATSPQATRGTLRRILFAGGGTGGHLYMAMALMEELRKQDPQIEFLFIGTERSLERRILGDVTLETIRIGGLKGVGGSRLLRTLFQIPASLVRCWSIIRRFRPCLVVGMGGYSSGPPVLVGKWLGCPCLIMEPNACPGLTNRLLARWVDRIALGFRETQRFFGNKSYFTGVPVRRAFYQISPTVETGGPLRLLIFGGSQGSRFLNEMACEALRLLEPARFSIVHQTGFSDRSLVVEKYRNTGVKAEVRNFIDDIPPYFSRSDLVISRAGACSLAEITVAGKPAILIPFPQASDDHQRQNARSLEIQGAAIVLDQATVTPQAFATALSELETDRSRLKSMAQAARRAAVLDSPLRTVQIMRDLAQADNTRLN